MIHSRGCTKVKSYIIKTLMLVLIILWLLGANDEVLFTSNINNWLQCTGVSGSVARYVGGTLTCNVVSCHGPVKISSSSSERRNLNIIRQKKQ